MRVIDSARADSTTTKEHRPMRDLARWALALVLVLASGSLASTARAACGDSIRDVGEDCDDGNVHPDDGCSALCTLEPGFVCRSSASAGIRNGGFELPG